MSEPTVVTIRSCRDCPWFKPRWVGCGSCRLTGADTATHRTFGMPGVLMGCPLRNGDVLVRLEAK